MLQRAAQACISRPVPVAVCFMRETVLPQCSNTERNASCSAVCKQAAPAQCTVVAEAIQFLVVCPFANYLWGSAPLRLLDWRGFVSVVLHLSAVTSPRSSRTVASGRRYPELPDLRRQRGSARFGCERWQDEDHDERIRLSVLQGGLDAYEENEPHVAGAAPLHLPS